MGEEAKKEEEPKVEAKAEEKKEEEKKEEPKEEDKKEEPKAEEDKKEEEKKTEEPPAPPPPVILQVDLHCVGCAKKIERCILRCKGVEGVEVNMGKNLVTIKGIVDPEAVCKRIEKKTMRKATIISPILPPPPPADQADVVKPQMVLSQVSEATTIELKVNMHCEACAQQLQRKIKKMRGVQDVETNLGAAQVKVTGTMTGEKLVEYIHRRTGKLATIIPPPPPPAEEKKEESDKKPEEKPEEKKEEKVEEKKDEDKPAEEGKEKSEEEKKEGDGKEEKGDDTKKEGEVVLATNNAIWHGGYMNHGFVNGGYMNHGFMNHGFMNPAFMNGGYVNHEEEMAKRSMMMNWMPMPAMAMPMPMHMPVYMIDQHPPPPQMFSDENPNACVIS